MQNHHSLKLYYKILILLAIAFSLAGCFKVHMLVDVNPNGSGTYGAAIGMTQEAKGLIANQGGDPNQLFSSVYTATEGMETTHWIDGDYEWVQGIMPFHTLNELNKYMSEGKIFESFSATRQHGFLKDIFMIEATISPLSDATKSENSSALSGIDPSTFIEIQLRVHLPGKVTETNGAWDSQNSTQMVWSAESNNKVSVKAISQAWNWVNIVAILLFLVGLIIIAIVIFFIIRKKQKAYIPNDSIPPI